MHPKAAFGKRFGFLMLMAITCLDAGADQEAGLTASAHRVNTTKFTIVDVGGTQPFYGTLLGMTELSRFVAPGFLDEPFMGFAQGGRIGLLAFREFENLAKTELPVSVVYVPDLAPIASRLEAAGHPHELRAGQLHVTDPSGNTIELVERPGLPRVGAARLIVDDLAATLTFFEQTFGVGPARQLSTDRAEEAQLEFGNGGMFLSLYEARPRATLW